MRIPSLIPLLAFISAACMGAAFVGAGPASAEEKSADKVMDLAAGTCGFPRDDLRFADGAYQVTLRQSDTYAQLICAIDRIYASQPATKIIVERTAP